MWWQSKKLSIVDVLLSITNFCLGSCGYCNLKNLKAFRHDDETTIKDIEKLLSDPLLDRMQNIHVTGGEPVLSPKTYEIFALLHELHPDIRVNMPVSGFFPYTTYRYCKQLLQLMPQLRVDISVDGPKEIHEKTRGRGTWQPVMKTIELLRSIEGLNLQLQLTLMETNYEYIDYVQDLAEGFGFYITFPHFGTRFGHKKDKIHRHRQEFIDEVHSQLINRWCKIRPLNMQIWQTQKAIWEGKKVYCDCHMGKSSIDVDPFGNVYPCMVYNKRHIFGNIRQASLTEISRYGGHVDRIFREIENKSCQPCLMPCCPHKSNFVINGKPVGF